MQKPGREVTMWKDAGINSVMVHREYKLSSQPSILLLRDPVKLHFLS